MKIKFSNRDLVFLAIGSIIFGLVIWQIIDGKGNLKTNPPGNTIAPETDDTIAPAPNTDGTTAPTPGLYPDFPQEWKNFKFQVRGTPNESWKQTKTGEMNYMTQIGSVNQTETRDIMSISIGGAVYEKSTDQIHNRTGVFFEDNKRMLLIGGSGAVQPTTLEDLKNDGPFDYVIDCNRDSMTFMCNAYLNDQKISWFGGSSSDFYSNIKTLDKIQKQDGVAVIVTYN